MGKKKTFNDFEVRLRPKASDYLVGFDAPDMGGEKKFPLAHLKNFIDSADITNITESMQLPLNQPGEQEKATDKALPPPPPFLNGKIFHVKSDNEVTVTLPPMVESDSVKPPLVRFTLVNLSENAPVNIEPKTGKLHAHGSVLRDTYDTAIIYFDGFKWYGYGDFDRKAALSIKRVEDTYTFSSLDGGKLLHFYPSENTKVFLPPASNFTSGTQFYVYNFSDHVLELSTLDNSDIMSRAIFLRRKYDDAVVYTDGTSWFATGDLS